MRVVEETVRHKAKIVRVLYSFPHKIGAGRICKTAWHQVNGLAEAGAEVLVFPGVLEKALPANVTVCPTLGRGKLRVPYKMMGSMRAFCLHDYIVSRRVEKLARQIDIIHAWPLGALRTLRTAAELGIPTVLERPNAHTQYAYETVKRECDRLGVTMPHGHEHSYNADILCKEEAEYALADRLLCPSEFVLRTFLDRGFPRARLMRHQYGFDPKVYYPSDRRQGGGRGLTLLFVGGCDPRKGLHYALEAWLQSPASHEGTFQIAGSFIPGYAEKLAPMLSHPSVRLLGYRKDVPFLMRTSDVLILPTIEEGSALVTSEARGSGCVLLVSEAAGAVCQHMENALVHPVGDIVSLKRHITVLHEDRALLRRLRTASLLTASEITWKTAGEKLFDVYRDVLSGNCC